MYANQAEFDAGLTVFRENLGLLVGACQHAFPDGYIFDPDPEFSRMTGTAGDEPMYSIAKRIFGLMECFDLLQEGLGLPPGEEPRFRKFYRPGPRYERPDA